MRYLLALLLTGCASYPLPEGMVVTQTVYDDIWELREVCGDGVDACVFTDAKTYCDMHLPAAANGEGMYREHELSHCGGRVDSPQVGE